MLSNFLQDMLDFAKTAKAWVAAAVVTVGEVITLVQVVVADEAITLDEAKGVYIAVTQAVTILLASFAVWAKRNRPVVPGDRA